MTETPSRTPRLCSSRRATYPSINRRGGPRHGPPHPPALVAPRQSRGAPRPRARSSPDVGGPDMAPHPPQRSSRPGKAVALLDRARAHLLTWGARTWAPTPPPPPRPPPHPRPTSPSRSSPARALISCRGGPRHGPPPPPSERNFRQPDGFVAAGRPLQSVVDAVDVHLLIAEDVRRLVVDQAQQLTVELPALVDVHLGARLIHQLVDLRVAVLRHRLAGFQIRRHPVVGLQARQARSEE